MLSSVKVSWNLEVLIKSTWISWLKYKQAFKLCVRRMVNYPANKLLLHSFEF